MTRKIISGKVREVYDVGGGALVIYTTDRISAFDVILPKLVRGKGAVLNAVSRFWFEYTKDIVGNHVISHDPADMPEEFSAEEYDGRVTLVKKLDMLPYEFIVRGYMFGNMWKSYSRGLDFCGQKIAGDYKLAQRLDAPLFTPSTKAAEGHDEYISYEKLAESLGSDLAAKARDISLKLYEECYEYAYEKGIIIADTKFEFGLDENGVLVLADEALTPDSSRFWSLEDYEVGVSPKSCDKQFTRDWLENNRDANGDMRFNDVPDDVLERTAEIYRECRRKICK